MEQGQGTKKQLLTTLAVLVLIVVIVGGAIFAANDSPDDSRGASQQTPDSTTSSDNDTGPGSTTYKNGTYTATGSYVSPGGQEEITIRITLEDNVITGTSANSGANSSEGKEFQSQFISGYKPEVVGKNIDSIELDHVSGSSLTSQGFNDALDQIKNQAQNS